MGNNISSQLQTVQPADVLDTKNFGAMFIDRLDVDFFNEKEKDLQKLVSGKEIPNVINNNLQNVPMTKEEYLYLVKNFVNYFNENNKNRMNFLRNTFSLKYLINGTDILYIIAFFCEFEDFKRTSKAQNILFFSLSTYGTDTFDFKDSIVYTKIIGQWGTSDVLFGNSLNLSLYGFYSEIKDKPVSLIMDEEIIKDILKNKDYILSYHYERGYPLKEFKTNEPDYYIPDGPSKIKVGNKCLNVVKNNRVIFDSCENVKSVFKFNKSYNIEYNNSGQCISYHKDNDMTLVPCNTKNSCGLNGNSISQNCNVMKPRLYGGLEVSGLDRKCLTSEGNITDCYDKDYKVEFPK